MDIELTARGVRLIAADGRVELGPALPAATVAVDGRDRVWQPSRAVIDADAGVLRMHGGPGGVVLDLQAREVGPQRCELTLALRNSGSRPVGVQRMSVLSTDELRIGEDPRRWRAYRNGHQSWSGTRTIGMDESDADVPTRLVRTSTTDAKHPSPTEVGHVRSDTLGAIVEPVSADGLGVAVTSAAEAFGFVELRAPGGLLERFEVWSDLDGIPLAPGAVVLSTVTVCATRGPDAGQDALRIVAEAVAEETGARGTDRHHPGGWCSWYYYFAEVTQADVRENLGVLAEDGRNGPTFACEYVMIDDGHQSTIGDWLDTDVERFPTGMPDLAERIRDAGFDAGIWWAPFLVHPASRTARQHPEWLLRNERGRPVVGILNPVWTLTSPMRVLDTTNPEVLDHLRSVARVIGDEWGYSIQKLDFLYAASISGVRHDRTATRAAALRRGLEAIRSGAGDDSFLLGCGCPFGPAVGIVDAMRIGADVTPYWSNPIDRLGGRGRHGLATRNAVVNVMTRAVLDRTWWLNDPDCLMVRDTDTKLTEREVQLLATVIGMTDGMLVLSDRLQRLGPERRSMIARARDLGGGRVSVPDLFERQIPELLVARHSGRTDVAVLNLGEHPRRVQVDLRRRGVDRPDGVCSEMWTGDDVPIAGGIADFGVLEPHSVRVLQLG